MYTLPVMNMRIENKIEIGPSADPLYHTMLASMNKDAKITKPQVLNESMETILQPLNDRVSPASLLNVLCNDMEVPPILDFLMGRSCAK